MSKHDPNISNDFVTRMEAVLDGEEMEVLQVVNDTIRIIEKDTTYSTSQKLKIYATLSSLCNCEPKERAKWASKAARCLK